MKEIDKEKYYGATPETFQKAKALRASLTNAEKLLLKILKSKRFEGKKSPPGGSLSAETSVQAD
jgi:very-short-patch-repair endonuclease